jgi:hypothetical protein
MADAEVYEKTVDDKVVILNTRTKLWQGFSAPNWIDLRVGFFLSLTEETADDTITGLGETIAQPLGVSDRYWIGVKDRSNVMPKTQGVPFIGFTNAARGVPREPLTSGDSRLTTSDIGVGTTNANFWRPNASNQNYRSFMMQDGIATRAYGGTASNALAQHFPQNVGGAGGYAVLLGIRLQRSRANSRAITASVKSNAHSADMLYSSVPTNDLLRTSLAASWPTSQTFGPVEFLTVPTALFLYWPFYDSRLRIHAMGIASI